MGPVHASLVKNKLSERPPGHGTRGEPVNVSMLALNQLSRVPDSPIAERARLAIAHAKVAPKRRVVISLPIILGIVAACVVMYFAYGILYFGAMGLALLLTLPVQIWMLNRPGPADIAPAMVDQMLCPGCAAELIAGQDPAIASCGRCHAKWHRSHVAAPCPSAPPSRCEANA